MDSLRGGKELPVSRTTALTFEERVVVPGRSLAEVFDYVSDFGRAPSGGPR